MEMQNKAHILLIDNNASLLNLKYLFEAENYKISHTKSQFITLSKLSNLSPDMVIMDYENQNEHREGLMVVTKFCRVYSALPVIILAENNNSDIAYCGALEYLKKPISKTQLLAAIKWALVQSGWRPILNQITHGHIIYQSNLCHQLMQAVKDISELESPLLICGDTGVGKDLLARSVHETGLRKDFPFVVVKCGSLPAHLLASELFGHEKGAFSGATCKHKGLLLEANLGTLLFEQIDRMPLSVQHAFLQVMKNKRVLPLGAKTKVNIDVRIMASTTKNMTEEVNAGHFLGELLNRIQVELLDIPSLRQRREDIPLLVTHYLKFFSQMMGLTPTAFSAEAMRILYAAQWPGNIRQLKNVIEHCLRLANCQEVSLEIVNKAISSEAINFCHNQEKQRQNFEKSYLHGLMTLTEGNVANAARLIDLTRTEFLTLVERYRILPQTYRN